MKKQLEQISEFHKKFGEEDTKNPTINIPEEVKRNRIHLMNEEIKEVQEAIEEKQDISDLAKELADLIYTVLGTVKVFGLKDKFEEIFDEVHKSNMSKDFSGKGMKPLKGPHYQKADIKRVLGIE